MTAEALRRARLAALAEAAAEAGALHLMLAHHALDQAETVLIRLARHSGEWGLAGMAVERVLGPVRLLRPLLGEQPVTLRALLRAQAQPWIEDPSNTGRGTRAAARAALRDRDGEGSAVRALLQISAAASQRRAEAERALALALAEAASISPLGYARLDPARFAAWDDALRRAAMAALLRTVGGHHHPVRNERLAPLLAQMAQGRGATAARCLVERRGPCWLIAREPAAVSPQRANLGSRPVLWDGRWWVTGSAGDTVGALGAAEAAALRRQHAHARAVPAVVLATLPAVMARGKVVAVPPILYHPVKREPEPEALFRPPVPLVEVLPGGAVVADHWKPGVETHVER